jgi:hypothetical protein
MWHDVFAFSTWSNWALVIVGLGGVLAALWTLFTIRKQTRLLRETVNVAKENISIIVAKERARLELDPGILAIASVHDPLPINGVVRYTVRCQGTTPATIIGTRAWAQVSDSQNPFYGENYSQLFIPTVLLPTSKECEGELSLSVPEGLVANPFEFGDMIRGRKLFVHFYGYIRYEDIFEGKWRYPFRYIWVTETNKSGKWVRSNAEGDNTETKDNHPMKL